MARSRLILILSLIGLVPGCGDAEISQAGVSVIAPTRAVVSEAGDTNTVSVVLTAQPSASVVIPVAVSDPLEAALDTTELVFTTSNWNQSQTITVTGLPDSTDTAPADPPDNFTLDFGRVESDDEGYDGLELDAIDFFNLDNFVAWEFLDVSTGAAPDGLSIAEGGAPVDFSVALLDEPFADVILEFALYDTIDGQVALGPDNLSFEDPATAPDVHLLTLTFTPEDYNLPQTFSVYPMQDGGISDPGKIFNLTVDSSGDLAYQTYFAELEAASQLPVSIFNLDPDSAEVVQTPQTVTICEGGTGDVYLQLSSMPVGDAIDVQFTGGESFGITFQQPAPLTDMIRYGYMVTVPADSVPGDRTITATMTVTTAAAAYLLNYGAGNETRTFNIDIIDTTQVNDPGPGLPQNILQVLCPRN